MAFKIIRNHLDKSSTAKWRSVEKAIDYLEFESLVNTEFDNQYYERLDRFKLQMEAVFNDFYGPL
jgi:hypothetical protein